GHLPGRPGRVRRLQVAARQCRSAAGRPDVAAGRPVRQRHADPHELTPVSSEPERLPTAKRFQELLGSVSSVVAPITLISAVLFYFGYVYTTTEYAYFGLDVDTIGLSTQEFIMR